MSDKMQGGVKAGSTDVTIPVLLRSTTDNTEVTGEAYGDVTASYQREGAARTAISAVTQTVTGAHTDGGFVEIDATNMPGSYRFDIPDAAFATGVEFVIVSIKVAGAYVFYQMFELTTNVVQGGDSFARLGAPAGASVSVDIATLDTVVDIIVADTDELQTNQGNWLTATGFATSSALATHDGKLDTVDSIVDAILVDTNELQTNQGNWLTAVGFSTHSAGDVWTAPATRELSSSGNAAVAGSVLTTQMTESYAADGVAPTLSQGIFMTWAFLTQMAVVTTTGTAKKLDGSTSAMTFTFDDASNPTLITRAT